MIASKPLFSVQLRMTSEPIPYKEYMQLLLQVEAGIRKLLHPLHLNSEIASYIRKCREGLDWMDVHLRDGDQLSFVDELESSIGSDLRLLDIELQAATDATEGALHTLRELQIRKTLKAGDFLSFAERRIRSREAVALGLGMQTNDNHIRIQFPQGQRSEAAVPHRRFSALCIDPVDLTFQPAYVGGKGAYVSLSGESMRQIGSSRRLIEASWTDGDGPSMSEVLYQASTSHTWVSAQCKVVVNRSRKPKALLIQMVMP